MCGGYYRYDEGYLPSFDDAETFTGEIIHPQFWPEDLDYAGKRVVVIGSGATAVTLVPAMADKAAHVTMLQRSPTYILSLPVEGQARATRCAAWLGNRRGYQVTRWKNVAVSTLIYQLASASRDSCARSSARASSPGAARAIPSTRTSTRRTGRGTSACAWSPTVTCSARSAATRPRSSPTAWSASRPPASSSPRATISTPTSIITATGLNLQAFGGLALTVDGEPVHLPDHLAYKGMMLSDVPNFVFTIGYTNASWTLKADLVAEFACRVLAHMGQHGYRTVVPVDDDRRRARAAAGLPGRLRPALPAPVPAGRRRRPRGGWA